MNEEKALKPPNQTDCKRGRHHKPSPHSNQTFKDHWSRGVRIEYKKLTFRREKIIAFSAVITNLTEQQQQQLDLDRSQQLSASSRLITGYLLPSSIMQASWIPSSKICQLACLFYLACKSLPTVFFIMLYFILFISTLTGKNLHNFKAKFPIKFYSFYSNSMLDDNVNYKKTEQ